MSTITQQPDALSFSRILKKFIVSSSVNVSFKLELGATLILDEVYTPGADNVVEIDVRQVVHRLLSVSIPENTNILNEQTAAIGEFTATIDENEITFTVIKGGVFRLKTTAAEWLAYNNLTWQPRDKVIIWNQPEFLGVYAAEALTVKVKAYFANETTEEIDLATLTSGKLWSVNVGFATIDEALTGNSPIAWDVWKADSEGVMVGYVQRYRLRNITDSENLYIWNNTLGGIDSVSFTGYKENDAKIEHLVADLFDDTLEEYDNLKKREVRQSTGYLDKNESLWIEDFFLSPEKYEIDEEGDLNRIALTESKVISSTMDDQHDYELTFRYSDEQPLLNISRETGAIPEYITEDIHLPTLIRDLDPATYSGGLVFAVQDPTSPRWYQMTLEQFISYIDIEPGGGGGETPTDAQSIIYSGTFTWKSGLTFDFSKFVYKIIGKPLQAIGHEETADPADPNHNRIDIAVLDKYGNSFIRKGTATTPAIKPTVAFDEIEITYFMVEAGALEPSNVLIDIVYDEHAPGEWNVASTSDSGITVNVDDTTDPLNGAKHISVKLNIPDEVGEAPTHYIGELYQGGRIFYIEPGGKKGLIAAPADQGSAASYQLGALANGTQNNTAIGMGKTNTDIMMGIANSNQAGMAAPLSVYYLGGNYTDWFLPSSGELDLMRFNKALIGGFTNARYWSSTESLNNSSTRAVAVDFAQTSGFVNVAKGTQYRVRAIRAFDDTDQSYTTPVTVYTPTNTKLEFTPANQKNLNNGILIFGIKSSAEWLGNTAVLIESYNGDYKTGGTLLQKANPYGFDSANPGYQQVAIQLYNFYLTTKLLTKFVFRLIGSWPNGLELDIDGVRLQYDAEQEPEVAQTITLDEWMINTLRL